MEVPVRVFTCRTVFTDASEERRAARPNAADPRTGLAGLSWPGCSGNQAGLDGIDTVVLGGSIFDREQR